MQSNASLYVDWQGEEFVSPSERISPEMLAQIVAQNTAFLPNSPTSDGDVQLWRMLVRVPVIADESAWDAGRGAIDLARETTRELICW